MVKWADEAERRKKRKGKEERKTEERLKWLIFVLFACLFAGIRSQIGWKGYRNNVIISIVGEVYTKQTSSHTLGSSTSACWSCTLPNSKQSFFPCILIQFENLQFLKQGVWSNNSSFNLDHSLSMHGNKYDTDVTVWSPEGKLHQVRTSPSCKSVGKIRHGSRKAGKCVLWNSYE